MLTEEKTLLILTEEVEQAVFSVCNAGERTLTGSRDIVPRLAPALDQVGLQCILKSPSVGRELEDQLAKVRDWHSLLMRRTYSVASFWSPSDRQRRSFYHGPLQNARQQAWAGLFFLLTRRGIKTNPQLFSATQYLAERATRKQSPPIVFDDNIPPSQDAWHVHKNVREWLLEYLGLYDTVTAHEEGFASILTDVLIDTENERSELSAVADSILEAVHLFEFPEELKTYYSLMSNRVSEWFHRLSPSPEPRADQSSHDKTGNPVDLRTVLFMELTYAIWYEANPETAIAYTFPSSVEDTVCVLTVGAAEPISPFRQSLLLWFSKTLFFHPLASEYQELAARHAYSDFGTRILNHNLKNHFLLPLGTHLRKAQTYFRRAELALLQTELHSACVILRHYDALAGCSAASLDESRLHYQLPSIRFQNVEDEFQELFDNYLITQFFINHEWDSSLKLEWKRPPAGTKFFADLGWILENLANLVSNSIKYGRMRSGASIRIECTLGDKTFEIRCTDSGMGCGGELESLQHRVETILKADEHGLLAVLTSLGPAHMEHGIGLRSCALHLRAAWQKPCPESMSIDSCGNGFEVTMRFPHAL